LSFVFRPPLEQLPGPLPGLLTLAAGAATRLAILRSTGFAADLKWPNDLMANRRKLAGILAEGAGVGSHVQTVILGIGINLLTAVRPREIASHVTSLQDELGHVVDRGRVIEEVLVAVSDAYDHLRRGKADDILREWREAAPSAEGSVVEWHAVEETRRGTTAGIDAAGALLVRTERGLERIVAGELTWL
jgi:BirA family biotin operon repressor/biotin-[acetyl-CoA-carboxylase] ligase